MGGFVEAESHGELALSQKLILLREIAYAMQQRRDVNNSQALLRKELVIKIIAQNIPDLLNASSSQREGNQHMDYLHYAEDWVAGIQESSGILVEQGLDQDGEPLIGFSHLTFQEYLSAIAINEVPKYQAELWHNLTNPSWREVILLFVGLSDDAGSLLNTLLVDRVQPQATLLAGRCLLERVKKVNSEIKYRIFEDVKHVFDSGNEETRADAAYILGHSYNESSYEFLILQLQGRI